VTLIEQIQNLLRSVATDLISGGQFKEVVTAEDGRQIVYEFPLATGMAWGAKKSSYSSRFGELPNWVAMLHPIHRIRICDLSLDAGKPLPQEIDKKLITHYLAKEQFLKGRQQVPTLQDAHDSSEERLMSRSGDKEFFAEFEVNNSGTLTMANFWEPQIRSEFYESVSGSWSESPAHLSDAMDECQPLSWAVHAIYAEIRGEIESDLDGVARSSGVHKKRSAALKARLKAMPEEPEEGAKDWLLALTSSEFEERVVPEIEQWFASPPNWNWEDDYLPRDGTAQGAALEFFQNMDGDALDALGVTIVEGEHPGSTYYAAELTGDVDVANKAAAAAGIAVRFKKGKG
jgi:hypothetical protein